MSVDIRGMHSKTLTKRIVSALLIFSLAFPLGCARSSGAPDTYEELLFDAGRVHEIDISIAQEDLEALRADPGSKTKYEADITIDGELIESVSCATKGNSSLQFVASRGDSDRYSYKINFGKYIEGQTYHGLDKLNLLNMFCDATFMKDFITYGMFRRAGVPAPLASYVWLTINGEVQGLYLAVEDIDESFIDRCYGGMGSLYKPENEDIRLDADDAAELQDDESVVITTCNGADLVYRGEDPALYTDIFDNDVYDPEDGSHERVTEALGHMAECAGLEDYLYTDEIIAYFAVHNFVVNYDSYTGQMLHNYYLYENDGRLAMLPWDYDLIFGGFPEDGILEHGSEAERVVNFGIDAPLNRAAGEDRPMWNWIAHSPEYLDEYHAAMDSFISDYFESGAFDEETAAVYEMIRPYVEQDPTAFYSAETFNDAYNMFRQVASLRAQSIRLQLDGELSTVYEEQIPESRVEASGINVMVMSRII